MEVLPGFRCEEAGQVLRKLINNRVPYGLNHRPVVVYLDLWMELAPVKRILLTLNQIDKPLSIEILGQGINLEEI